MPFEEMGCEDAKIFNLEHFAFRACVPTLIQDLLLTFILVHSYKVSVSYSREGFGWMLSKFEMEN